MDLNSLAKGSIDRKDMLSSGETAYDIIAAKILSGELPHGEKLSIRAMAALANVSTIPVIEALRRLEHEGLVESFPHWGSRVVALSPETIHDRNSLREAIECQVVRMLAESGLSEEQCSKLHCLAEELDSIPRSTEPGNSFWNKHYEFHTHLVNLTGCLSLKKALYNVNLFHFLQRITISNLEYFPQVPRDPHHGIVQAIQERNPEAAEKEMRRHIRSSRNYMQNIMINKET